jgi:hypothetical protein
MSLYHCAHPHWPAQDNFWILLYLKFLFHNFSFHILALSKSFSVTAIQMKGNEAIISLELSIKGYFLSLWMSFRFKTFFSLISSWVWILFRFRWTEVFRRVSILRKRNYVVPKTCNVAMCYFSMNLSLTKSSERNIVEFQKFYLSHKYVHRIVSFVSTSLG